MCELYNFSNLLYNFSTAKELTFVWRKFFSINRIQQIEYMETWNEKKSRLKLKFTSLLDSDLLFDIGKKDDMIVKLQNKLGKTKEELQKIIDGL